MPASRILIRFLLLPAAVISLTVSAGCNSSSDNSTSGEGGQAEGTTQSGTATQANTSSKSNLVTTGPGGRTLIDGIPVEVFYDDPLAVAAQSGNVTQTPSAPTVAGTTNETPKEQPDPEPAPPEVPKAETVDWSKIIPMENLDAEIKAIRNFLTPTLQTVASYNRDCGMVPPQGMTMAALAQVALHHPGDALWKDNAAALRDLSYNLANSTGKPGRASFDAATLDFEKILLIFNGSDPGLEEAPDPAAEFADHVDRGPIMKRIDLAHRWLTSNTPAATALKDSKEKAFHETIILGTLLQVCGDKSYLYTDEPNYQTHVSEAMAAVQQMRDAIETENYDNFKEGLAVISRKCTECHSQYKDQ